MKQDQIYSYDPAANPVELGLRWLRRARESQFNHYRMAVIFERLSKYFGVPVIIVTSIVSASVFTTLKNNESENVKAFALGLSLLSVVLSSLQTFFNFSDRADKHRKAGADYAAIRRKLEIFHASSNNNIAALEKIGVELSDLASRVPSLASSRFSK